jgi:hypothetical protein
MPRYHRWSVRNLITGIHCPAAEIDVLKPDWVKLFVETAQLRPDVLAKHEESAGWLFHEARLIQVAIQVPVRPVDRVGGPQPIDPQ